MICVHGSQSREKRKKGKRKGQGKDIRHSNWGSGRRGEPETKGWKRRLSSCKFHCSGVDPESLDYGCTICNVKFVVFWDADPLCYCSYLAKIDYRQLF